MFVTHCRCQVFSMQLAGNRIWGKELELQLMLLDWSPDSRRLLFCTTAGDCHIVDAGGNLISKVPLHCKASIQKILGCICTLLLNAA